MTKQQLINELKSFDSEYLFEDIGYGCFYDRDNSDEFRVLGEPVKLTKKNLQEMYDTYLFECTGFFEGMTKKELLDLI